ncbi:hypothetical protein BC829DRAFT_287331 [Chytridium lagenaria]|nr:hypothetical protein BC829DRAFT_287331 [Chytridium lagenaria]
MTPRSYKAASSVRSPSSLIIKAILLISLLTLPASINAQDDEQPPSEGETTTALEDPTSTTTTSPSPTAPPQPTVRASDCIKLTTSSACPSFQSGWIYTKGRVGTVERFDRLVLDTVYANASAPSLGAVNVVVASGCAGWDEGRVRYARGFFCSLYLTLPDVIGGVAGSINDCNIIATSTNRPHPQPPCLLPSPVQLQRLHLIHRNSSQRPHFMSRDQHFCGCEERKRYFENDCHGILCGSAECPWSCDWDDDDGGGGCADRRGGFGAGQRWWICRKTSWRV